MSDKSGTAFPITEQTCAGIFSGLSKREYFAGRALEGILSNPALVDPASGLPENESELVGTAVRMAERLIDHLCEQGPGEGGRKVVHGYEVTKLDVGEALDAAPTARKVLEGRSTSAWLNRALSGALSRDPVDAANDAELLHRVLERRCKEVLGVDRIAS